MENLIRFERLKNLLETEDIDKAQKYYESGEEGKKNLANAKIDKFIKAYLQDCKYNCSCKNLKLAEDWLKECYDIRIKEGIDNWILATLLQKFIEYRKLKEKIKGIEDQKEKEKHISILKSRGLYEI